MSWNTRIPKFRRFVLQNFPFIEEDFDALTDYELICKVVEYLNKVITSQNEVVDELESLEVLFNELQSYVNNYFDNLDVQEEINNKLDAMVEAGTLQEIIADYLNTKAIFGFDTVASMKAATNLVNGSYARTLGYYAKNDGGEALFKIRTITNDDVVDETSIYQMAGDNNLVAELIIDDSMNVKQFGIIGDGTTDIYTKLTAVLALGVTKIYFPAGTYVLSQSVNIPSDCKTIEGENVNNTIILCNQSGFVLQNVFYNTIKNITLKNADENNTNNGITGQLKSTLMENVRIQYFERGLNISGGSWVNTFLKCIFENNTYGVYKDNDGDFNDNNFLRCNISANTYGAYIIASNQNNFFTGCDMESNTHCVMSGGYTTNMHITECYCEGNDNIYAIISGFGDRSDVTIEKCRIYQPNNTSTGWIAIARTMSSATSGKTSPIIVKENLIIFSDVNYKPFAFDTNVTDDPNSLIVFNILQNSFAGTAGNNYPAEYYDLIDRTNFANYGKTGRRITINTDLIYKVIDTHLFCKLENRGIRNGAFRSSNLLHFFGYKDLNNTTTSQVLITIPNECGVYSGYDKKFVAFVHYSDETIDTCPLGIDANTMTIRGIDTSKTAVEVSVDFFCSGTNSN